MFIFVQAIKFILNLLAYFNKQFFFLMKMTESHVLTSSVEEII